LSRHSDKVLSPPQVKLNAPPATVSETSSEKAQKSLFYVKPSRGQVTTFFNDF
jgi:hypothetical protein